MLYVDNIILFATIFLGITRKVSSFSFLFVKLFKSKEELFSLSLSEIEIILASNDL